jgi:two-component system sensor histidine kinase RpfC
MIAEIVTFLQRVWRRIALRRADALGREQGQSIVRVAIGSVVLGYLLLHHYPLDPDDGLPSWLVFLAVFLAFSTGMAWSSLRDTRSSVYRRMAANTADVIAVTYLMINTGEAGAPLFVIYLWVTLGNGFRFGLGAMGISALLSVAGFGVVIAASDLWRQHTMLSVGVLMALIVLPAYTAHLIRQLHRARERAEEASAAKSQFLARMSHELRTPLNGILGTADILQENRRFTVEDRELLGVIKDSVAISLRQINNVLDFSRIEAGKLVPEQADFDLHRLLQSTVNMVAPAAREKNLPLLLMPSPSAPFFLVGDGHHLREVLLNLLSNAVKFTERGYVALRVEPVSIREHETRLRFEIRDTGIGIATEALEHIWESFAQEDTSTTRRYGGTGLGTTIAKQLVELMGGRIAVSSIKGRGTVFWFDLPFTRQPESFRTEAVAPHGRVLLLTANSNTAEHMRSVVEASKGTLQAVTSAADAVAALGRGIRLGNPWHVLLVDEKLMITAKNLRGTNELAEKTKSAQTPCYLLTDTSWEIEQLCESGYAGIVPRQPTSMLIASVTHASPHFDATRDSPSRVVNVEPWAWGRNAKANRRILIADDNRTNCLILEQILASAGYAIDVVNDGEAALERLAGSRYIAAVLDLHMPGLDGVDLLRRYRLLHAGGKVPIIMLTADVTFEAKSDCAEAGADAFLTKPVTADTLLSTLDRLIHEREVHVLPLQVDDTVHESGDAEPQVLDVSVLAELDRLCRDPVRLAMVVEAFESEGEALLTRMAEAVATRAHPAFTEWVHAMKGNAANIGAMQLMEACRRAEAAGVLEFRRDGAGTVRELREHFAAARHALRELAPPATTPERSGPG